MYTNHLVKLLELISVYQTCFGSKFNINTECGINSPCPPSIYCMPFLVRDYGQLYGFLSQTVPKYRVFCDKQYFYSVKSDQYRTVCTL